MKNFINSRIEPREKLSAIEHNIRTANKRVSPNQIQEKIDDPNINNYIFINGVSTKLTDNLAKIIKLQHIDIYKEYKEYYREAYKKRRGRYPAKSSAAKVVLDGVFTFSEQIDYDLDNKYSKQELFERAYVSIDRMCKMFGTEIIPNSLVFHQEEFRNHFHYQVKNFDNMGLSIHYKIKNSEFGLDILQDIAAEEFGKLGLKRGVKKVNSGKTYTSTYQWKLQQNEILHIENQSLKLQNNNIEKTITLLDTMLNASSNLNKVDLKKITDLKVIYKDNRLIKRYLDILYRMKKKYEESKDYEKEILRLKNTYNKMSTENRELLKFIEIKKSTKSLTDLHAKVKQSNTNSKFQDETYNYDVGGLK